MKYKQYQKYKDSGVEWIGEIPEHWESRKLKFTTKFENSTIDRHVYDDEIPVSICHYPQVYNNETISLKTELPKGTCNQKEFENFRLKKDDVLITKDSETPDDIGVPVYILDDFKNSVCGYHIAQLSTDKNQLLGGFLFRFIQSSYVNAYFETEANGITRYGLGKDSISNLIIPLPPKPEQQQIYDFLQKETKQFSNLISKSQSQINLLQEKRQALINHAVTKGLDPTVPMKDSGVEWIGEIPEHWEVRKIKHAFGKIGSGTTPSSTNESYYGDEIHWVNSGDLNDGYITETKHKITKNALDEFSTLKIYPKDTLIIALYGATIGKLGILKIDSTVNQACCAITEPKKINQKFLFYWLLAYRKIIISMAVGGGQPNISQSTITNLRIQTPDFKEQEQIYAFLDKETKQFDNLISKSQSQIKMLQEKRQAIITAAVTGKIDVRK